MKNEKSKFLVPQCLSALAPLKKSAFTLAEVLITLAIIGVVAAMTIPTLVANYEKKLSVVRFQKAYAEIIQAVKLAEAEYGSMNTWTFGNASPDDMLASTKYFFENYLKIKTNKSCFPVSEECWATTYTIDGLPSFKSTMSQPSGYSAVMTKSGYTIFSQIGQGQHNIVIDTNGKNKPNKLGKDVFLLIFDTDKQYVGVTHRSKQYDSEEERIEERDKYCSSECESNGGIGHWCGISCGAVIFDNNWKIPENYPW